MHATTNNLECKRVRVHPSGSFRGPEDYYCRLQRTEDCCCEIGVRYCTANVSGDNDVAFEREIGDVDFAEIKDRRVDSLVGVAVVDGVGEDFQVSSWHCCWACRGRLWRTDCT